MTRLPDNVSPVRNTPADSLNELHRGVSFGYLAKRGYYATPEAAAQVDRMAALGVTWVALMTSVIQETFSSTRLYQDFEFTPSDDELAAIIDRFHARGIRVMLKPMVECLDSSWRGRIHFPDGDQQIQGRVTPYWDTWFASLAQSVVHYAGLARRTGCEMYCIGCELYGAEQANNNDRWHHLISTTRKHYTGPICYDVQPPTLLELAEPPAWLRSLDAVCISYYSSAADAPGATIPQMIEKLRPTVAILRRASEKLGGLPIIFGETGCRSVRGGAILPGEYRNTGPYAPDEQANFLDAMCTLFWDELWWRGFYWWKWEEQQYRPHYHADPAGDTGFTLDGKPAADVMRRWFARQQPESHPASNGIHPVSARAGRNCIMEAS
ncbi:hypothetical protein OPIT5_11540 [Opitutaceae bacterium TAV5]|nr:hypothetical protein OPIT5_11540 [Opitutaceae bacterium TAV5]